ncbi:class I SAM-dependent methyltransferase [Propionibacteriaceae bacterium Y2011]|uniref:class I SAM-dependent methyltransferase n=1 Tax=Microlunatus sp. Y2014 TaxID=3418488 RepID=UPI003B4E2D01
MTGATRHDSPSQNPQEFWEGRYRDAERVWSGRPNPGLVNAVQHLAPGKALDLGCGEGADAIWLATQGWIVTGVDISATATARARREAQRQQASAATRFVTADLARWEPDDGPYDLVTASFLHSPVPLPRIAILQRAAATVRAGGHLVVLSHAAPPPWVDAADHPAHSFSSPARQFVELNLNEHDWLVLSIQTHTRHATAPSGEAAELTDGVLLLQRR